MKKRIGFALMLLALASSPALASWCGIAARYNGECSVCNGMCLMEQWFDSLGGW